MFLSLCSRLPPPYTRWLRGPHSPVPGGAHRQWLHAAGSTSWPSRALGWTVQTWGRNWAGAVILARLKTKRTFPMAGRRWDLEGNSLSVTSPIKLSLIPHLPVGGPQEILVPEALQEAHFHRQKVGTWITFLHYREKPDKVYRLSIAITVV